MFCRVMFLRCCSLLALPETVFWGPACCAGAVSDQRAKFDAALGWESEAMPPSNVCSDTDLVTEGVLRRVPVVHVGKGGSVFTVGLAHRDPHVACGYPWLVRSQPLLVVVRRCRGRVCRAFSFW